MKKKAFRNTYHIELDIDEETEYIEQQPFGDRNRELLNLKQIEVDILNSLRDTDNYFNSHDLVKRELISLFLNTIEDLKLFYIEQGSILNAEIEIFRRKIISKNLELNSYQTSKLNNIREIVYQCIFKTCEKTLRIHFMIEYSLIKLSNYLPVTFLETYSYFFNDIVNSIIEKNLNKNIQLSIDDEVFFNNYGGKKRYEKQLIEIERNFRRDNLKEYINKVLFLERSNLGNPKIKNIFYRSTIFIADYHKETAIMFYLYYVYYDLISVKFQFKQLPKKTINKIFAKPQQQDAFADIVNQLFADNDLTKAIDNIPKIFTTEPKKIILQNDSIKIIFKKHLRTVEKLNDILSDENEESKPKALVQAIKYQSIKGRENMISGQATENLEANSYGLSPLQMEVIGLFSNNGFSLSHEKMDEFAKNNGLFVNQFLNSVNEDIYDIIDDILIEERDGNYFLNEGYFSKHFKHDNY